MFIRTAISHMQLHYFWTELCAEQNTYYARLYGLTRDELRYILDPKEVHGEDFPGETFRVLIYPI